MKNHNFSKIQPSHWPPNQPSAHQWSAEAPLVTPYELCSHLCSIRGITATSPAPLTLRLWPLLLLLRLPFSISPSPSYPVSRENPLHCPCHFLILRTSIASVDESTHLPKILVSKGTQASIPPWDTGTTSQPTSGANDSTAA